MRSALIAFDGIMKAMPEYRAESDSKKAFALCELPARNAGYVMLKQLLDKRASILFDHGASFEAHVDLLRFAKQRGYHVILVRVTISPEVAKQRIQARQSEEGRHTPLHYVDERKAQLDCLLSAYREAADSLIDIENPDLPPADRAHFFDHHAREIAQKISVGSSA